MELVSGAGWLVILCLVIKAEGVMVNVISDVSYKWGKDMNSPCENPFMSL